MIKEIYHLIPLSIRKKLFGNIMEYFIRIKYREKKINLGNKNSDKVYYVIRYIPQGGLFGLMNFYLPEIKKAIDKKYIPIIDMQNYKNMYLNDTNLHKENAWEYYFLQPLDSSLKDIAVSKNIILSNGFYPLSYKDNHRIVFDKDKIKMLHDIYVKYVRLNINTKKYIDKQYFTLFHENDKVLGCLCRGTDYVNNKPHNHPIQPDAEMMIKKVEEVIKGQKFNKIFLATEDQNIWNKFVNKFGNLVVTNNHTLYKDTGNTFLPDIKIERENGEYLSGLEYLTTITLLSKCNGLVAGIAGGSIAALYISSCYEYTYFFDLGLYE